MHVTIVNIVSIDTTLKHKLKINSVKSIQNREKHVLY